MAQPSPTNAWHNITLWHACVSGLIVWNSEGKCHRRALQPPWYQIPWGYRMTLTWRQIQSHHVLSRSEWQSASTIFSQVHSLLSQASPPSLLSTLSSLFLSLPSLSTLLLTSLHSLSSLPSSRLWIDGVWKKINLADLLLIPAAILSWYTWVETTINEAFRDQKKTVVVLDQSAVAFLSDTDCGMVWLTQLHNRVCFLFHLDGWTLKQGVKNAKKIENLGTSAMTNMTF